MVMRLNTCCNKVVAMLILQNKIRTVSWNICSSINACQRLSTWYYNKHRSTKKRNSTRRTIINNNFPPHNCHLTRTKSTPIRRTLDFLQFQQFNSAIMYREQREKRIKPLWVFNKGSESSALVLTLSLKSSERVSTILDK